MSASTIIELRIWVGWDVVGDALITVGSEEQIVLWLAP